jgi:glycosyltransferase 2 family protein
VMAAAVVIGSIRWWILLAGAGIHIAASASLRPFAGALLLNNVLPTAVGGDALRVLVVGRKHGRLVGAAAATIVDRISAIVCLFAVAWVALILDPEAVPREVIVIFPWVTVGLLAVLVGAGLAAAGVRPLLHRLPSRLAAMLHNVAGMLRVWASPGMVAAASGLGILYQVTAVVALIFVGKTVGVDLPFALAAVSAAIVVVAILAPISIGGFGVREGGFVILLGQAGIAGADAAAISLLGAVVIMLSSAAVVAGSSLAIVVRRAPRPRTITRQAPRLP